MPDSTQQLMDKCVGGDEQACVAVRQLIRKRMKQSFESVAYNVIKAGVVILFLIMGVTYAIALEFDIIGTIWMMLALIGVFVLVLVLIALGNVGTKEDNIYMVLIALIGIIVTIVLTIIYVINVIQALAATWNV